MWNAQIRFLGQMVAALYASTGGDKDKTIGEIAKQLRDETGDADKARVFVDAFVEHCEAARVDGSWLRGEQ